MRFDVVKPGERVHNLLTTWLCNDGNDIAGDGCYNWHIEPGWNCWQKQENGYIQNVPCYRLCGNTQIDDGESCDDGNQLDGDGCSKLCQQEDGYSCDGLHCYLLNQTDTKHNGNSPTDAIDIAADKYQITLEDFTANGYILDKSCTDYSDDSTSQKALFIKTNLTAGQMLKAFMATEEEQKQYSVNYIRSINGNTVTCYRKDSYGKFFASKNQTLTMIVKQRNSATGTPAFRMHKYYPICGDGTAEGFEQCDPGTPMEASTSYKYCENCMLVGNDAGNTSCAWVTDAQEYYCSTYTHYTGFAGSCGGAAVFEDEEGSVTTYFKYKYNQDNEFMRANSARSWEPDISSCTGGDTSLNNHYSFIMRYDLKAGDRLTFSGKTYNSYDGVIKDTFYIVGDDCWHGQCLFSGSAGLDNTWVSDKDQQVWAVIQQSIYWAGTFDSASITLKRAN